MSYLKNPYVLFALGVIVGATLLKNRVSALPLINKIPSL